MNERRARWGGGRSPLLAPRMRVILTERPIRRTGYRPLCRSARTTPSRAAFDGPPVRSGPTARQCDIMSDTSRRAQIEGPEGPRLPVKLVSPTLVPFGSSPFPSLFSHMLFHLVLSLHLRIQRAFRSSSVTDGVAFSTKRMCTRKEWIGVKTFRRVFRILNSHKMYQHFKFVFFSITFIVFWVLGSR